MFFVLVGVLAVLIAAAVFIFKHVIGFTMKIIIYFLGLILSVTCLAHDLTDEDIDRIVARLAEQDKEEIETKYFHSNFCYEGLLFSGITGKPIPSTDGINGVKFSTNNHCKTSIIKN